MSDSTSDRVSDLQRRVDALDRLTSKRGALPVWRHCLGCETRFAVFVVTRRDGQTVTVCPLCRSDRIEIVA